MLRRLIDAMRELRAYPRQFWLLVAGTFVYVAGAALGFPYEAIFLHDELGISTSVIGIVFGVVPLCMIPLQIWGGSLTDRMGRRRMLIISTLLGVVWFAGFAYSRHVWQIVALTAVECAFGWPLYQTASNAMVADLLEPELRAEAYSVVRVAMNLGVVVGPAVGALALSFGASFRQLFLAAAAGCALFSVIGLLWMTESGTVLVRGEVERVDEHGRAGFAIVRADRRFLIFSVVALLPVMCMGLFGAIYAMFITDTVGVAFRTWGLLLAMNAAIVATLQFPLVRAARSRNHLRLLAGASLLVAIGMGGTAFATTGAWLVLWVVTISLGEILLSPIAATIVSDMSTELVRGRYMSIWTVIWSGGASLAVLLGGVGLQHLGGRTTFFCAMLVGVAGALALLVLSWTTRRAPPLR